MTFSEDLLASALELVLHMALPGDVKARVEKRLTMQVHQV